MLAKTTLAVAMLCGVASDTWADAELDRLGGAAFVGGCLMTEPSYEKLRDFAGAQQWKVISETATARTGERAMQWQVATSGTSVAQLRLHAVIQTGWDIVGCEVVFPDYRDKDKSLEKTFLDQIARRPTAKLDHQMVNEDSKRLDYRDGAVALSYYDGPLADPRKTPWVSLSAVTNRLQKQ